MIITLLPKVSGANLIRQFQPIALINTGFKLLVKGFAMRVSPVANRVIDQSQSAFIRGRSIVEGISVLHEVLHSVHLNKEDIFILKLDFEKAYDHVNCDFMEGVMRQKGLTLFG